ncbi:hypothetical protein ACFL20_01535 [Spirochaetota bacterium]
MKKMIIFTLAAVVTLFVACKDSGSSFDHATLSSYEGASTCLGCHDDGDIMGDIMSSTHYTFTAQLPADYLYDEDDDTQDVTTRTGSEQLYTGKFWKLCGFPTALPYTNWVGNLRDNATTEHVDVPGGCGQCHIGMGFMPSTATQGFGAAPSANETTYNNVDCLVCHSSNYSRKVYTSKFDSKLYFAPQDENGTFDYSGMLTAAQSVGKTTSAACLKCHGKMGGGATVVEGVMYSHKRGVGFDATTDVHAAQGMTCSDCHSAGSHKVKRGPNADLTAYDNKLDQSLCLSCHNADSHPSVSVATGHMDKMACTTCHVTTKGGVVSKDFSKVTCDGVDVTSDPSGSTCFDAANMKKFGVGVVKNPADFKMSFMWFNGKSQRPIHPLGSSGDGKIYPFKKGEFNQPVNAAGDVLPQKLGAIFKMGSLQGAANAGLTSYNTLLDLIEEETYGLPTPDDNSDSTIAGYQLVTDYFSISHGITRTNALGQSCGDCHGNEGAFTESWDLLGHSSGDPTGTIYDVN